MADVSSQYFIVTCHGWSASNWVAYSLNQHPKIACGHSSAAILATDPALFDGKGLAKQIPRLRTGYVQRQNHPITEVYAELEQKKPALFTGTVHTYRLRDLPVQSEKFARPSQQFRTVNLVRHPLDLVVSGYGQFRDLFPVDLNELSWTLAKVVDQGLDIVERVCHRHGIRPGDFDSLCFFGACVVMNSLRLDLQALRRIKTMPDSPWRYEGTVRMEDITTTPAAFSGLVDSLTGQPGLASKDYLESVFSQGRINRHNRDAGETTTQRWHDLKDWQKDAFAAFLHRFDLRPAYEALGYDFSFMNARAF